MAVSRTRAQQVAATADEATAGSEAAGPAGRVPPKTQYWAEHPQIPCLTTGATALPSCQADSK